MDLSRFQAVLLDLDGTLYSEEHALPGAAALVRQLRRQGRLFACLSNSTLSPAAIAQRLERMSMEIEPRHIYSAAEAVADYVRAKYRTPRRIFNLGSEGVHETLGEDVVWVESGNEPCDAVIAGAPTNVYATEERQRKALLLLRAGAELIGICPDRIYPSPRGLEFGVGALCAMLGYAARTEVTFCGKPHSEFFQRLCRRLNVDPTGCVLIGDNVESDIAGAKAVGMHTILVLTGVTARDELHRFGAELQPDAVVRNLEELAACCTPGR